MKQSLKQIFASRPEKLSRTMKWLFGLPLTLIVYLFAGLLVPSFSAWEVTSILRYMILIAGLLATVKYFNGFNISKLFSSEGKFRFNLFAKAFFLMFVLSLGTTFILMLVNPENFEFTADLTTLFKDWIVYLFLIIFAALFEELLYRSYVAYFIKDNLETRTKQVLVYCLVSALLFSLSHINNPEMKQEALYAGLFYFMQGFVYMLMFIKKKGIEIPLAFHIANNLASSWFFAYDNSVIQTNALFLQHNVLSPVLLIQSAICLVVCAAVV